MTAIPQRIQVSVRVYCNSHVLCDGHDRWSKATALSWCQNVYQELSQFHSQGILPLGGGNLKERHLHTDEEVTHRAVEASF